MVHKKWLDKSLLIGEIVKEENIRLVYLLDLRADFGVKTNAKLMPIFKQNWNSKLSVLRNPDSNCVNYLAYILYYTISLISTAKNNKTVNKTKENMK